MNALVKVVAFLLIAALSNLVAVASLPRVIHWKVTHEIAREGENAAIHAPRPDASSRAIVRPSPDLLYTACVYDVSESPLYIRGPVADGYVSISGFSADTTNFFAVNDAQATAGLGGVRQLEVVVAGKKRPNRLPYGVPVFDAPTDRGLILFRTLITSDADAQRLQQDIQAHQECIPD